MFSSKVFISMLSLLSWAAISFAGATSYADDLGIPVACQKAAQRQVLSQLLHDSGWTAAQADQFAYLHDPTHLDGDPQNVVTVSVESTDIRQWDGYAAYKVTIAPSSDGCQVSPAVLLRADGF
jgi:hypothetical protein